MRRLAITILLFSLTMAVSAQSWELRMAKQYIENGDYKSAALKLRPLAEGGNAEAQYLAAGLFLEGKGVIKSEAQAVKYYQMSAQQLYEPAIGGLLEYYGRKKENVKAYMLVKGACDRNEDFLLGELGLVLGVMQYEGKGTEKDMEQGWKQMFKTFKYMKKTNHSYYDDQLERDMEKQSKVFAKFFIDKYTKAESLDEKKFLEVMVGKQNEDYFLPEWNSTVIEMLAEKIPTLNYAIQSQIISQSVAIKPITIASCFLVAYMYYNGYGVPANLSNAKIYANALVGKCNGYPFIVNTVNKILSSFAVGENINGVGTVESVEGDNVTIKSGYTTKTMTKSELYNEIKRIGNVKKAREQRKQNMTATSRCPQINAGKPHTSYENGTLEVTIPISLKAMNKCELTASNGRYKDSSGRWKYATCRVVGLTNIGGRYCLMPGKTSYLCITIKGASSTGEIPGVSADLKCNYGTGAVTTNSIIW